MTFVELEQLRRALTPEDWEARGPLRKTYQAFEEKLRLAKYKVIEDTLARQFTTGPALRADHSAAIALLTEQKKILLSQSTHEDWLTNGPIHQAIMALESQISTLSVHDTGAW